MKIIMPSLVIRYIGEGITALWLECGWHASEEVMDSDTPAVNLAAVVQQIQSFYERHQSCTE